MPKMFNHLCYYVVAHQDDWQLFFGQQAYSDLAEPDSRVVFIYTTAGDAGGPDAYWQAREKGAVAAQTLPSGCSPPKDFNTVLINKHPIATCEGGSFVSYHMRLPDGNVNGHGFESTGNVSLEKLQIGCLPRITAVDTSTSYHSWDDFCATLGAIIERERASSGTANPWVNAADWSWRCSPRDHSDHKATANALRNVFCQRGNIFNRLWFVTYSTDARDANLSGEALEHKQAIWLAYAHAVGEPIWWEWNSWGAKNYIRLVDVGQEDIDGFG
jgi:hypothetical protein